MATLRTRIGSRGATAVQRADTAAKHARVIELRIAGLSLDEIAARVGLAGRSGAHYHITSEAWRQA